MQIYKQNSEAVLPIYLDILRKVNGNRMKEVVFNEIDLLLSHVLNEKEKAAKSELSTKTTTSQANMVSSSKDNWRGIPTRLNNIPHSREIREYFYDDVLQAIQRAVNNGKTRLKVEINIPELNPEMVRK
nr:adenylate kinase 5, chloroplastic isoform X1 [Ipomoea batatas]